MNGDLYEGFWYNDVVNGYGKYINYDKNIVYEGEWDNNLR